MKVCRSKLRTVIVPMLVAGVMAAAAPRAEAVLVGPGESTPAAGIDFPGGTELDSVFYEGVGEAELVVDVAAAVFENGGFMDFYYQVSNHSAANLVHRLTGSNFTGFITDVWFVNNGGAVPCEACPTGFFLDGTQEPLTFDSDEVGEVIGFNFPDDFEVNPGESSLLLLIQTQATVYEPGFVSVINSGTYTDDAFDPGVDNAPEPASLLLFGIGLLGTGAAMRRKRKA